MELVLVMAVALALVAIGAPSFSNLLSSSRASEAARLVERQLQTARLKAVTTARTLRVRLSCPAAGQLRILEVTGVGTTDNASNRCDPAVYPSPGPRDALRATPSLDSPVVYLPPGTTIAGSVQQFQFDPRGSVSSVDAAGGTAALVGDVTLTITREGWTHIVRVNAVGRISVD